MLGTWHFQKLGKNDRGGFVALFNDVDQFHDPIICQLYYVSHSNKPRVFVYYFYIHDEVGNLGGVRVNSHVGRSPTKS